MRFLVMITSFALSASFGSFPSKLAPEGQVLIRDSYLFENAKHSMTGFAPASGGPHKLVVVLTSTGVPHDAAFAYRRISLERTVAMQGHGAVIVEYPDFESYPDSAGSAEFAQGKLAASRAKVCAEWVRKGNGVIAGINKLCARDEFDCSSGIALSGNSQGGGVAVQVSKLYSGVNALLTTQWAPLLGGGAPVFEAITGPWGGGPYLLPPHPLALHWCGFDDTGNNPPTWSTFPFGGLQSVSADQQYSPALSTFVNKTKRLSLISAQDGVFGNPTEGEDPAASAPVFSLQRDLSGYYDCPDTQNDCTQADGSGYFVVPAGVIPAALDTEGQSIHSATAVASVTDAFIGEKWHSAAAFKWLGDAAFGA